MWVRANHSCQRSWTWRLRRRHHKIKDIATPQKMVSITIGVRAGKFQRLGKFEQQRSLNFHWLLFISLEWSELPNFPVHPVMTSCPAQPLQKPMLQCPRQTALFRGHRKRFLPQVTNIQPPRTFPAALSRPLPPVPAFPTQRGSHANTSHSREPILTPPNAKSPRTLKTNTCRLHPALVET